MSVRTTRMGLDVRTSCLRESTRANFLLPGEEKKLTDTSYDADNDASETTDLTGKEMALHRNAT